MEFHNEDISARGSTPPLPSKTDTSSTDDLNRTAIAPKTSHTMATQTTPTYVPVGYPDFGNIWSSEPKPLPGPENHPFFLWIAEGAIKDPAVYSTNASSSKATHAPSPTPQEQVEHQSSHAFRPQTNYPVVPAPTSTMEPITPKMKQALPFASRSSSATPDLSFSPTEPSPLSTFASTPAKINTGKSAGLSIEDGTSKSPHGTPPLAESDHASTKHEGGAPNPAESIDCTSTYRRRVTNDTNATENRDSSEPLVVLNGEIWRSGGKWRRHQWSTDVGEGT